MNNLKEELKKEINRLYSADGVKGLDNWGKVRTADQFDKKVIKYDLERELVFKKKTTNYMPTFKRRGV